jgi:hypothetical protein
MSDTVGTEKREAAIMHLGCAIISTVNKRKYIFVNSRCLREVMVWMICPPLEEGRPTALRSRAFICPVLSYNPCTSQASWPMSHCFFESLKISIGALDVGRGEQTRIRMAFHLARLLVHAKQSLMQQLPCFHVYDYHRNRHRVQLSEFAQKDP